MDFIHVQFPVLSHHSQLLDRPPHNGHNDDRLFVATWQPWPQCDSGLVPPRQRSTGAKHCKHSFSRMALPGGHSHTVSSSEVLVSQWTKAYEKWQDFTLNLALLAFRHPENGSTWFHYQLKHWHCKLWKLTSCRKSANRHIMGQVSFSGLPFSWTRNVSLQFGLILLQLVPLPDQPERHWHSSSGRNSEGKTSRIVLLWSNSKQL